ncbi:ROK family transcriptional regulator [Domibacillus sp. 8LH]|uniref:ROK family transcriptional regulator n=1 Tax=Domibacillus sp. 8LH TaxID=3073900 RepID=UPI0031827633
MLRAFLEDTSKKNEIKKSLYKLVHKQGPISKKELLTKFQVPKTTITRMIYELEQLGLIQVSGYGEANGGRPPVLYDIVPHAGYLIGIEIARTHMNINLFNMRIKMIMQRNYSLTKEYTPEKTMKLIEETIQDFQEKQKLSKDDLIGIGIGAVGPLDRKKGIILNPEAFLGNGWTNVPVNEILSRTFSGKITLNNGADMAALAEYYFQMLDEDNILYCMNGYAIRCGYISEGRFLNNKEGDSNSYGHMIIQPGGRKCACGNQGCLTAYASLNAIFEKLEGERFSNKSQSELTEVILKGLREQDSAIQDIVMEAAYYYGIGIANMINILHPAEVVLHGKLIYQSDDYYHKVIQTAKQYTYSRKDHVVIRKGALGENAASIGAAVQVFYEWFDDQSF